MKLELTKADEIAIENKDSDYILNKGAKSYKKDTFKLSIEYYRIAASMGNPIACSNLGYCYMYGRSVEKNMSLAIAYFKIAASKGSIDGNYKLGDIYKRGLGVESNHELAIYYFDQALMLIRKNGLDYENYPSLCLCVGIEYMPNGYYCTDIYTAYLLLKNAKSGYEKYIENGDDFYKESYDRVLKYLNDPIFDDCKEEEKQEDNSNYLS